MTGSNTSKSKVILFITIYLLLCSIGAYLMIKYSIVGDIKKPVIKVECENLSYEYFDSMEHFKNQTYVCGVINTQVDTGEYLDSFINNKTAFYINGVE